MKELGLPIMKATSCLVGAHIFIWTSGGGQADPSPTQRCSCGLYTWQELQQEPVATPETPA